jgi:hypothetical protein
MREQSRQVAESKRMTMLAGHFVLVGVDRQGPDSSGQVGHATEVKMQEQSRQLVALWQFPCRPDRRSEDNQNEAVSNFQLLISSFQSSTGMMGLRKDI